MRKLREFCAGQWAKIRQVPAVARFIDEFWPHIEKFLIAGPTLIGFIIGLLRYPPKHAAFEVAFQSLVIFTGYLTALLFVQALDTLFLSSFPLFLGISRSILATGYIALTLMQYLSWRTGTPRSYAFTDRMRLRLSRALGDAR